jgi:hypothetical protein
LSDGSTVFEDLTPNEKSSWIRLRDYVHKHNLKVTNLRLEAYGNNVVLIPYKTEENEVQIDGYWHSKRIGSLLHSGGVSEMEARGIGIVKNREVWITWVYENGVTRQEIRSYKQGDLAAIVNE